MGPGREQVQVIPLEAQGPQRLETLESTWKTPMVWDVAKLTSTEVDGQAAWFQPLQRSALYAQAWVAGLNLSHVKL